MTEEIQDLQNLINAVIIAQSKGAYKLEESEILSKSVKKVVQYINSLDR